MNAHRLLLIALAISSGVVLAAGVHSLAHGNAVEGIARLILATLGASTLRRQRT